MDLNQVGSVRKALGAVDSKSIATIPTGIHTLDVMIGGGFPNGRCMAIAGPGGSGKSTLLWSYLDNVAKYGGVPVLIDPEFYYTEDRALELGHTTLVEKLILINNITAETFYRQFQQILATISSAKGYRFGSIVIDSWSDVPSTSEMESGTPGVGVHAKQVRHFFRNSLSLMAKYNLSVIFVCQDTKKINMSGFGRAGGNTYLSKEAIFSNSFLEMHMVRVQNVKRGASTIGFQTKVKVNKNKLAAPFQELLLDYYFHSGYDKAKSLLDALVAFRIASKTGGWYTIGDNKFQATTLRSSPETFNQLQDVFYEAMKLKKKVGQENLPEQIEGEVAEEGLTTEDYTGDDETVE